jgi:hypothetical protein
MSSNLHLAACTFAILVAAGPLAACSGSGLGDSNQVIVRLDDAGTIEAATTQAEAACSRRGGTARLIALTSRGGGGSEGGGGRSEYDPGLAECLPDAIFVCDPRAGQAHPPS